MEVFLGLVLPFLIMFVMFYFLLIRPQNKERKRLDQLIAGLKKGDKILTTSGIIAKIETINEENNKVIVSSEGSRLMITKNAIIGLADES